MSSQHAYHACMGSCARVGDRRRKPCRSGGKRRPTCGVALRLLGVSLAALLLLRRLRLALGPLGCLGRRLWRTAGLGHDQAPLRPRLAQHSLRGHGSEQLSKLRSSQVGTAEGWCRRRWALTGAAAMLRLPSGLRNHRCMWCQVMIRIVLVRAWLHQQPPPATRLADCRTCWEVRQQSTWRETALASIIMTVCVLVCLQRECC